MAQPWFDPALFESLFVAIAGGVGGTPIGLAEGIRGDQARKGEFAPRQQAQHERV